MDVKDNLSSTTQFFGSSIRYLVNFVCLAYVFFYTQKKFLLFSKFWFIHCLRSSLWRHGVLTSDLDWFSYPTLLVFSWKKKDVLVKKKKKKLKKKTEKKNNIFENKPFFFFFFKHYTLPPADCPSGSQYPAAHLCVRRLLRVPGVWAPSHQLPRHPGLRWPARLSGAAQRGRCLHWKPLHVGSYCPSEQYSTIAWHCF